MQWSKTSYWNLRIENKLSDPKCLPILHITCRHSKSSSTASKPLNETACRATRLLTFNLTSCAAMQVDQRLHLNRAGDQRPSHFWNLGSRTSFQSQSKQVEKCRIRFRFVYYCLHFIRNLRSIHLQSSQASETKAKRQFQNDGSGLPADAFSYLLTCKPQRLLQIPTYLPNPTDIAFRQQETIPTQ